MAKSARNLSTQHRCRRRRRKEPAQQKKKKKKASFCEPETLNPHRTQYHNFQRNFAVRVFYFLLLLILIYLYCKIMLHASSYIWNHTQQYICIDLHYTLAHWYIILLMQFLCSLRAYILLYSYIDFIVSDHKLIIFW